MNDLLMSFSREKAVHQFVMQVLPQCAHFLTPRDSVPHNVFVCAAVKVATWVTGGCLNLKEHREADDADVVTLVDTGCVEKARVVAVPTHVRGRTVSIGMYQ